MEKWIKLKGFEGHQYGGYFISNYGRIKNGHGKILSPNPTKKGYLKAQLWIKNKRVKMPFVHRLVAMAFIPNPNNLPQINHKDTVKTNNYVDNLEWCTNQQNANHAMDHGLMVSFQGERHPRATITLQQAKEIRTAVLDKTFRRSQLAEKYGVSEHVVKDIRRGKNWNYA